MATPSNLDLFGDTPAPLHAPGYTRPRGYAGIPGTGPAGEICGNCAHCVRTPGYAKCKAALAKWTHGRATDILLNTPACAKWQPRA
jgi:hypothetical protein